MYTSSPVPRGDLAALENFLESELQRLANDLEANIMTKVQLAEIFAVPSKPREGMVVFADGTAWNPGSGRGVYVYSSGTWVKL
jgi:hypothetical protein